MVVTCTQWHHWAHPGHGLFYFTSHAVSWPLACGPRWTDSLGASSLQCAGQGGDNRFLRLSLHTASVDFHPMALQRDLPGPPCQKKGIEYPTTLGDWMPVGLLAWWHGPPWHPRMELSPPSATDLQDLQRLGWFSKGHTRGHLFRAMRWDDSNLFLDTHPLNSHSCLPILPFRHSHSTEWNNRVMLQNALYHSSTVFCWETKILGHL